MKFISPLLGTFNEVIIFSLKLLIEVPHTVELFANIKFKMFEVHSTLEVKEKSSDDE